jgi:hypothetical protein
MTDLGDAGAARWHLLWAVLCLGAGAAVTVVAGRADASVYAAFAALAGVGLLGWALHGNGRVLLPFWAAAAAFAVGAAGGLTGPGVVLALLPLGAGAVLGRSWRVSLGWVLGAAALALLAEAAAVSADPPEGLVSGVTAAVMTALTAWSWISSRVQPPVDQGSPEAAQVRPPELAPGATVRDDDRADALALARRGGNSRRRLWPWRGPRRRKPRRRRRPRRSRGSWPP